MLIQCYVTKYLTNVNQNTSPIAIGVIPSHPVILRLDSGGGRGGFVQWVPVGIKEKENWLRFSIKRYQINNWLI